MGIGGIGFGELLIILVVVMLIFGTKRLKTIGSDLGGAIKGFRSAMADGEREATTVEGAATSSLAKPAGEAPAAVDSPTTPPVRPARDVKA
jgi:sec-independent protein translocase protein TatA